MNILDMKAHPLAEGMPPLAEHEDAALEESMQTRGFDPKFPIVVWLDPDVGEDRILDGLHRRAKAKKLGLDRVPTTRFEGSRKAAIDFVHFTQLARRAPTPSQRAGIVARYRKEMELGIEAAAKIAGCSVSQMEKASSLALKGGTQLARVIKGEASVHAAAKSLERVKPEFAPAGDDPMHEIWRARDKATAIEHALSEIGKDVESLCGMRGGEVLAETLRSRGRMAGGKRVEGYALVDEMIQTVKRTKPKAACKTCNAAGCSDCGNRRYVTAHEEASHRNAKRG